MKTTAKGNFSCRRQIIAFCIVLLCSAVKGAEKNKHISCLPVKNIPSGKLSISGEAYSFISPPYVYYFTEEEWDAGKRLLKIYSINIASDKKDSFNIDIPETIKINYLPGIALSNDYLILIDDEQFDLYRYKKSGNTFNFTNRIILPPNAKCNKIKLLEKNKFLLYSIYNNHPDDNAFNSNLGIYDVEKDMIINFIHPDLPCIGFSHFMNNWVTINDHFIALANPCGYKIVFYNFNLDAVDSISYNPGKEWKGPAENKIPFETNPAKINPKLLIDKMMVFQDTISRIERIYFVNNSTLLVSSTGPGKNKRRIDIWNTSQTSKPVYSNPSENIEYSEDDTINIKNVPLQLNTPENVEIKNNLIYSFNEDDYVPDKNSTIIKFNHQKDLYYEKYDPQFSIRICKIILP